MGLSKISDDILSRAEARFGPWQRSMVFERKRYTHRTDRGASEQANTRLRQKQLIRAVQAGPVSLGGYLRKQLGLGSGDRIGAPELTRSALTVNEYLNPPIELEAELGRAWADKIKPRRASQPVFWLLCHIDWIEQRRLGSGDLSLFLLNGPREPNSERKTRNFLRRTGGIFVRGKTSPLSDCTLARAWWRYHLSCEIADASENGIGYEAAHRVFHTSRPVWETLVTDSLRRLVAINHPRARAAIVSQLNRRLSTDGRISPDHVRRMGVALARLGLRSSLDHLDSTVLAEVAAAALD